MTRRAEFDEVLHATGAFQVAADAERDSTLVSVLGRGAATEDAEDLVLTAEMLELEALDERDPRRRRTLLEDAFACWVRLGLGQDLSPLSEGVVPAQLALVAHLAATGTGAERVTETRQALIQFLAPAAELTHSSDPDWVRAVVSDTVLAFVLLARKDGGWADVSFGLQLLESLRTRQETHEHEFLNSVDEPRPAALRLVAGYHLAQLATTAGKYIETGGNAQQTLTRLDTHRSQAQRAVAEINDGQFARLIDLVHLGLRPLVERSIWAQVETLGSELGLLASELAGTTNERPTLELWPSQVQAMRSNLLDAYRRAVVVQMPTSAGKTLLAKFSIVQTLALNKAGRVAYVVPTRVLVNQVTDELRRDFAPLNLTVEQAIPVVDLDPTEDLLLQSLPHVLVTTPEKLDLLVRTGHPVMENLSMVVVDEAHNIGEPNRGARLELVLATIRRDKPAARFLLLSPFMPNADSLSSWLGGDRGSSIQVDWKPNKKLIGEFRLRKRRNPNDGRRKDSYLTLEPIPAADNYHLPSDAVLDFGKVTLKSSTLASVAAAAHEQLQNRGATLLVVNGKSKATTRAEEIAKERLDRVLSPRAEAVLRHVETELGDDSALAMCIRRGVAYHHSGMSLDTRRLVEELLSHGDVDVVCGTTTLAQGANFPLTNVIIESIQIGEGRITHSQFWNIAGRAGRGMLSGTGVVGFPIVDDVQKGRWDEFFKTEATDIASRLADVVARADEIGTDFLAALNRNHEMESFSEFLQYLAHALRVSGAMNSANEIEDLLRSSLIFAETERVSRSKAQKLVQLCRSYLDSLQNKGSLVALADGTGFSTPAISLLMGGLQDIPDARSSATWEPETLFSDNVDPLTQRLQLVARMPELRLAPDDETGSFDARRAARIIRDWVNGSSLAEMVEKHARPEKSEAARHAKFVAYLLSRLSHNASWGLGALEKVALGGKELPASSAAGYVPTMIFYGVNTPEATWMRMAGLPREVARGVAEIWRGEQRPDPQSFDDIRGWVKDLDQRQWARALEGTSIRPEDVPHLW